VRELVSQFTRFLVVGLGGLIVDLVVFNVLRITVLAPDRVEHGPIYATIISTGLAILVNWLGNRYWTFRVERRREAFAEMVEFFIVSVAGSLIALGCLWISHYLLGFTSLLADNIAKNVVGLALGTAFRFVFYRIWVFRKGRGTAVVGTTRAHRVGGPVTAEGTIVVIPTYNEAESLPRQLADVLAAAPEVRILVVDDASPDGTGRIAEAIAADEPRVNVLHRTAKEGLGRAYLSGFAWGLEQGASVLVEMDADGSHPASALPAMLERLAADPGLGLVIGSRWVEGGAVQDWPWRRLALSRAANTYARLMLGLPVRDITAGYRVYRAEVLADLGDAVRSRGYAFQIDLTQRTHDAGWRIAEVPIVFREREAGQSKMSTGVVLEAMGLVTRWGIARLLSGR